MNLRFGIGIVGGLALIAAHIIATQISAGALFLISITLFIVGSALFIKFGRKSGPYPLGSTEERQSIACHSIEKKEDDRSSAKALKSSWAATEGDPVLPKDFDQFSLNDEDFELLIDRCMGNEDILPAIYRGWFPTYMRCFRTAWMTNSTGKRVDLQQTAIEAALESCPEIKNAKSGALAGFVRKSNSRAYGRVRFEAYVIQQQRNQLTK